MGKESKQARSEGKNPLVTEEERERELRNGGSLDGEMEDRQNRKKMGLTAC